MTIRNPHHSARLAAVGRLQQIQAELDCILEQFPDLRAPDSREGQSAAATAPPLRYRRVSRTLAGSGRSHQPPVEPSRTTALGGTLMRRRPS